MKTILSILLGLTVSLSYADTHYVDINNIDPQPPYTNWATASTNIQFAIDEADTLDTVLVADGTYLLNTSIYVYDGITLRSTNNAIIDGSNTKEWEECIDLRPMSVLDGFTVQNGYSNLQGGGIYSVNGIIKNCIVQNNSAMVAGGIYWNGYFGTISNTIVRNNSTLQSGGGIGGTGSIDIYDCIVSNNYAEHSGGGIYVNGNGLLENNIVVDNAANMGAGIYSASMAHIVNCFISGNAATNLGGGIFLDDGVIDKCYITNNVAHLGGGIYQRTDAKIMNTFVAFNEVSNIGGGIYIEGSLYSDSGSVKHCTIVSNTAPAAGGLAASGRSYLYNTIISQNNGGDMALAETARASYCFTTEEFTMGGGLEWWRLGNVIGPHPEFISSSTGDYRLDTNSPCIDSGRLMADVREDIRGFERPLNDNVDIGMFEMVYMEDHDSDLDGHTNLEEYYADTDMTNALDNFHVEVFTDGISNTVVLHSTSLNRTYDLFYREHLERDEWIAVTNDMIAVTNTIALIMPYTNGFYQGNVNH